MLITVEGRGELSLALNPERSYGLAANAMFKEMRECSLSSKRLVLYLFEADKSHI